MEIYPGIEIVDLALYIKKNKILVITDTQIGMEESLNKQGILVPRFQFDDIIKRLDKIFSKVVIKTVVINGDIKHEFGEISDQEWRNTLKLLDYLMKKADVILVKGNHDTILGPIADKRNLKIVNHYNINNISILHGHKIYPNLNKLVIIGHEHPAISLKKGARVEKFRCYLKGKWNKHVLIVQPSFNFVRIGTDILKEKLLSPFLQNSLDNYEVYVVEDNIYSKIEVNSLKSEGFKASGNVLYFGKVGDLRSN